MQKYDVVKDAVVVFTTYNREEANAEAERIRRTEMRGLAEVFVVKRTDKQQRLMDEAEAEAARRATKPEPEGREWSAKG